MLQKSGIVLVRPLGTKSGAQKAKGCSLIDFSSSSPLGLQPDDEFTVVSDVCVGNVVCFVCIAPHRFELITLQENDFESRTEPKYSVERGSEPGLISLITLSQTEQNQKENFSMSPATQDQISNHLEFLGYEVQKQDYGVFATHPSLPNITARLFNEGIILSTYYSTNDFAKSNQQRVLDFVNTLNQKTLATRFFIDSDLDFNLVAFFPNEYEKLAFGRFFQIWKSDYDIMRQLPESDQFLN